MAFTMFEDGILSLLSTPTDVKSAKYKAWMASGTGVETAAEKEGDPALKNDGSPYDYWVQHITNKADVLNGAAPIVEDKGPYRFIGYRCVSGRESRGQGAGAAGGGREWTFSARG